MTGHDPLFAFEELLESIRESMVFEGRAASEEEMRAVLYAIAELRAENDRRRQWAKDRGVLPLNVVDVPDFRVLQRELSVAPEPARPVMLREESVHQIIEGVTSATRGRARPIRGVAGHAGGAPLKLWPRLAISEATRMWVNGAYQRSTRRIADEVTTRVIDKVNPDELAEHGWSHKRPFRFSRHATGLVVAAIDRGQLEWDDAKGLGVLGQFSTIPEWLQIPRRKPAS